MYASAYRALWHDAIVPFGMMSALGVRMAETEGGLMEELFGMRASGIQKSGRPVSTSH